MSFDGAPRPTQVNPYANPLNPYAAAHQARAEKSAKPLVQGLSKDEKIKALEQETHDAAPDEDDEHPGEALSDDEAELIRLFAKMRGLMNFSLEQGVRYEFQLNPHTGWVDLIKESTGECVLQLTPEELMQLSEKIQRYAGRLTDQTG